MKKILFVIAIFIPYIVFSQTYEYEQLYLPKTEGKIVYQSVISSPGMTSDQLYTNARKWFVDNFKTSEKVIEYESKEAGLITGNGSTTLTIVSMGLPVQTILFFSVKIEVKDQRFRYQIQEITMTNSVNNRVPIETFFSKEWMYKKNGDPRKASFDWYTAWEAEITSLESSIRKEIPTKGEDW